MTSVFSFNYGEKRYVFSAEAGAVYELDNGVTVRVDGKTYKEYDAVDWVLYFENTGNRDSQIFSDIWDCDTLLPFTFSYTNRPGYRMTPGKACVITMNGPVDGSYYGENDKVSATEFNFNYEYLDKAEGKTKTFANLGGRSSNGTMPFFDVTAMGSGYITAIGWTGDWKAEFCKRDDGIVMRSGLKETAFYLKPGEKIRTSSVLIMKYTADEDKHNKWRRLIKNRYSHKSCTAADRDGLMACELWGGLSSAEMKKRLDEFKKYDISFEDIWIDAGWYGKCTKCDEAFSGDWGAHTGEWEINTAVHPDEFTEVAESAKNIGAKLMLWFEPERAMDGTKITLEHPEWFLSRSDGDSKILNYGNDEAWNYVYGLLSDYTAKLGMSCYRQDFNVGLTSCFEENDEPNRRGIVEIKHITGMYRLWDELLAKFPGLIIDNCSSGGRRIDIETLKRSIPFFRSDYQCVFNENSEVLQTHNSNISAYLPYNGCTSKTKNDTYAIRSSYSSSWGGAFYNAIFQTMDEEDFKWAKKVTDEYRYIRRYMHMDFYNHGADCFDESAWAIWQYHDPEAQSGIVMAFRRVNSPFDNVSLKLSGMLKDKEYTYKNLNNGEITSGMDTLKISLPEKRTSVIFEYTVK